MTVAKRLMLAFGVVILVFMAVAGTSLVSGSRLAEADKWNQHTYKVLSTADRMLQSMVNMETGARGYLVAGDEAFLAPWTQARRTSRRPGKRPRH